MVLLEQLLCNIGQVSLTTALVIVPLLALRRLLHKRYPARVLCFVWMVLVVRLLVPVQLSLPKAPVQVTPRLTRVSYAPPEEPASAVHPQHAEAAPQGWVETAEAVDTAGKATYFGVLLFLLWLAGARYSLSRQLRAYSAFSRRLQRTAQPVESPELLAAYQAEAGRLGIQKPPPFVQLPGADGPMLAGILHPVLVIPAEGIDPEAAPLVLRHELTHYLRHDLWWKLLAVAARCVHWFNPAAHWLVRALFEDIELACDSRVVEGMDSEARRRYGRAILDCAAGQCAAEQSLTTRFTSGKEALRTRLGELFATGAKKRGTALLLICAMTVGIAGGVVSIRAAGPDSAVGPDSAAGPDRAAALTEERLSEASVVFLAECWAVERQNRNYEPVLPYLTAALQREVFEECRSFAGAEADAFRFDPDADGYGVPEGWEAFWRPGVSSPYANGYVIQPDPESGMAELLYNWHASGSVDLRSRETLTFAREDGEWKIAAVTADPDSQLENGIQTAADFRDFYGNDLGLPDFLNLAYCFLDPVEAAEKCFALRGGSGEVTGQVSVDGNPLGNLVTYTFADGSAVDLVMSCQSDGGYIPVDWRISGEHSRTMLDLACQWARGVMAKDTRVMFPLLTERAEEELIAVQKESSGGEEWDWRHGKYGSSLAAMEFGVFPGGEENTLRIVYALEEGGEPYYRGAELLRFRQEPFGLKIDSVRELAETVPEGRALPYEQVHYTGLEWFRMYWLEEPLAGNLSRIPDDGWKVPPGESPPGVAGKLLKTGEALFRAVQVFSEEPSLAMVRLDFLDGSGQVYVLLCKEERWCVVDLREAQPGGGSAFAEALWQEWRDAWQSNDDPVRKVGSAEEFMEAHGELDYWDAYYASQPITDCREALETYLLLEDYQVTLREAEVFGKPLGYECDVEFADDSKVTVTMAEGWDGRFYPVDWRMDGGYSRSMNDLAMQWIIGVREKETRLLFPILTQKGAEALLEVQKAYSGEDWVWKHGRYGSSPTAGSSSLWDIDDHTVEVVYNEVGGGYLNHRSVERLYFAEENGILRLDRWEAVEPEDESAAEWYATWYAGVWMYVDDLPTDSTQDAGEAAKLLAGLGNGDLVEADVETVAPCADPEDGYLVTLRFADGSGKVQVRLHLEEAENGSTWKLDEVSVNADSPA